MLRKIFNGLLLLLCSSALFSWDSSFQIEVDREKLKPDNSLDPAGPEYVNNETFAFLINRGTLEAKLQQKIPNWMREQIHEDFKLFLDKGISEIQVERTFETIRKNYPSSYFIRYRIINNELYRHFNEGEPIYFYDNTIEKSLKTLLHFFSFEDSDFIIFYEDGIPLAHHPKNFYFTEIKEFQAPIFCSAKLKGTQHVILIPDWRSVSRWWAFELQRVIYASNINNWESKKNYGFWRGSCTNPLRFNLCKLSLEYPDYLDARINAKLETPEIMSQFEKEGIYCEVGWVPWETILQNKYLPLVDGVMTASPAVQSRLLSNSVMFLQDFDGIEWFFRALRPYVHYIPVKHDLSDLLDQFDWASENDDICKKISENATAFAKSSLMMEDVYLYYYLVLSLYSSLQKLDSEQIKKEMEVDPHWVKIHRRAELLNICQKKNIFNISYQAYPPF